MTKGVLIFALNNDFDYVKLAEYSAKKVKAFLNLPVTLVTNIDYKNNLFDNIIKVDDSVFQSRVFDDGSRINWMNLSRYSSYELSPYDETIVIDADYIINSNHLNCCFDLNKDFLIYSNSFDISPSDKHKDFVYLNQYSIPFYWATVFYFKKTQLNKLFFQLVQFIKNNWNYYRLSYQILEKAYRNDFAFSIAIDLLFKHIISDKFGVIPGKIYFCTNTDLVNDISENSITINISMTSAKEKFIRASITKDLHVMNKFSLVEFV